MLHQRISQCHFMHKMQTIKLTQDRMSSSKKLFMHLLHILQFVWSTCCSKQHETPPRELNEFRCKKCCCSPMEMNQLTLCLNDDIPVPTKEKVFCCFHRKNHFQPSIQHASSWLQSFKDFGFLIKFNRLHNIQGNFI